ncbi:MAG: 3-phosphoglycerate dehydrogenase [Planctomycetota bacterium]|nr:MAG: 3-phosphoglycerate dehydrogenase [Planctomycetota bacterium]
MPTVTCLALNSESGPHVEMLRDAGFELRFVPDETDLSTPQAVIEQLRGSAVSIAGGEPYTREVIEALPELRVIARSGVGYDAIDLQACDERGVVVTITPGVNHHSVAEHTIALLMGVARGFPEADRRVRECRWKRVSHPRVMGRTLGLIGLGRIGQAVATRAIGLGMTVIAYDPFPDREFARQHGVELVGLDELLRRSDFVSLHLPATPQTRHLMNAERFSQMKPGSVFLNTARGSLVDEGALIAALESGPLRAAGLDVFETEPLPADSPLLRMPNVLLSGHVAGLDDESHRDTYRLLADTVLRLYRGEWPAECIVNRPDREGKWQW